MKILNFASNKFSLGKVIEATKDYNSGNIHIVVGEQGLVTKITMESFPDLCLFDLKIIHMDFINAKLGMEEKIALEYFKVV